MIPPPQDAQPVEPCFGQCGIADLKATLAHLTAERQWLDIATAPKDGARVWLATVNWVAIGWVDAKENRHWTSECVVGQRLHRNGIAELATHWMPLPKGPTP